MKMEIINFALKMEIIEHILEEIVDYVLEQIINFIVKMINTRHYNLLIYSHQEGFATS
jgi:hypothetical protein